MYKCEYGQKNNLPWKEIIRGKKYFLEKKTYKLIIFSIMKKRFNNKDKVQKLDFKKK